MMASFPQNRERLFDGIETRIEEAIKCQACKKQVCWPIVVCFQGHGICSECQISTKECYVCKSPLMHNPPSLLENLLKILPKRCKYHKFGCQSFEYVYDNHEEHCVYRNITCMLGKDSSCEWCGSIKDWFAHGLYDHNIHAKSIDFWPSGTKGGIFAQYYDFNSSWISYNIVFQFQDEHFILYSEKYQGLEYHANIVCLSTRDSSNDCTFKVSFLKGYTPMQRLTLMATPFGKSGLSVIPSVPLDDLYPLVDKDGNLNIHIVQVKKQVAFQM